MPMGTECRAGPHFILVGHTNSLTWACASAWQKADLLLDAADARALAYAEAKPPPAVNASAVDKKGALAG
jgi:hypothetical protein